MSENSCGGVSDSEPMEEIRWQRRRRRLTRDQDNKIIKNHHHQNYTNLVSYGSIISQIKLSTTTTRLNSKKRQFKAQLKNEILSQRARRFARLISIVACLILVMLFQSNEYLNHYKQALAFNIDTQYAIIHHGPEGSYFGYTVAQHKDRGAPWLLVGAPKAQTNQPDIIRGGAVYKCSASSNRACQQIMFDQTGQNMIKIGNQTRQSGDKSGQWFGGSLYSASDNGSIVACAPLYVHFSTTFRRRDPIGTCFVSRGSFDGFMSYSPCKLDDQWGHHHMGSCQAGFSSVISKDGSRLFMGAPGSHVWQGQVFKHNLQSDLSASTSAVNPHDEDDSYIGYSLALGRFSASTSTGSMVNSNREIDTDLAIGVPRGNELAGKVMLVDRNMKTLRNITGDQMGAYFGYSLATADINGDGLDDLLIGAPLYFNQTISHKEAHFERGRIYVALQTMRHEFPISQKIDGYKNRARFGTSIANCGDLNKDGYQDIAVGAPYDGPEQHGAIYIFMGHREGLSEEFDQVIYAESLPRPENALMRSFGFSLSGGQDLDGNGYPDLLVGDYSADRAVLLKTRPVVNVVTSVQFQPEHFNLDDKRCLLPNSTIKVSCISVTHCTKYSGLNVDNRTSFVYDYKLDSENKGAPRLFFLDSPGLKNEDRNTSFLTKDKNQCNTFKAYISREIRDKLTPLKIDIDYNLASEYTQNDAIDLQTGQVRLKPILNKSQANKVSKVANIQKNCGPDNICDPNLRLSMSANMDHYVIGSNEKLILDVSVRNLGEDAFESMFYLHMPMTINFIRINKTRADYPACFDSKPDQTGVNILTCDLGNPQGRNETVKFSVITEPARSGQFTDSDFTFRAIVNSTNPEQERFRDDNTILIGIPIRVQTELVLSGNSQPTLVVHNSTESSSKKIRLLSEMDLGEELYHTYQLQNKGPSTINDIAISLLWPTKTRNGDYLLYLVDEPLTSNNVKCKSSPEMPINPLNLKYERGNAPHRSPKQAEMTGSITRSYSTSVQNRFKRQLPNNDDQLTPETLTTTTTVDNSILQQLKLSCGPTQCNMFECNVLDLAHNEIATIKIRSRLYEQTLNSISMKEFDISSKMVAQIKALPYNVSTDSMPAYNFEVKTQVRTIGLAVQDLLPWWLIVLAIILGITLFILLACFLKYLGFFARKRPPKNVEREPLTPTAWDNYQYTPGDTAL